MRTAIAPQHFQLTYSIATSEPITYAICDRSHIQLSRNGTLRYELNHIFKLTDKICAQIQRHPDSIIPPWIIATLITLRKKRFDIYACAIEELRMLILSIYALSVTCDGRQ